MANINIQLDEETLSQARHYAAKHGASVESLVISHIRQLADHDLKDNMKPSDPLTGLFPNDSELMDQIVDEAMRDRARRYSRPVDV